MRIALTADLHWGARRRGDEATQALAAFLHDQPPDVLVLAGDIGAGDHFGACLALFDALPCRKALVPGNHDIWVTADDPRGSSLEVYREHLPRLSAEHNFHFLDAAPLLLPDADLGLVGSINWYDYSWGLDGLRQFPWWEEHLAAKRFTRGRHNDANFVRWPLDDVRFTRERVTTLERHLGQALATVARVLVVTHHPPFYGLGFDRGGPPVTLDSFLWDALLGNRATEELLTQHAERIAFAFCGHTHRAREQTLGPIRGYNIGGDYEVKRLLVLSWPAGTVEAHVFGLQEQP
jgi:3',5'-cyclic AMP phosphodiesterase CpdA